MANPHHENDNRGTSFTDWGYWLGSNLNVAADAMTVMPGSIIAEGLDDLPQSVAVSTENAFNYLLGINPISFSYVSSYGRNVPDASDLSLMKRALM